MKLLRSILPLLLIIFSTAGVVTSISKETSGRVWIFFKDKPQWKISPNKPSKDLNYSSAVLQRRATRGVNSWEESDFPVDASYVETVRNSGATIRTESRWLNAVSANCNSDCVTRVRALPFVQSIQPVLTYRRSIEAVEPVRTQMQPQTVQALSYGQSREQLLQINVPPVHNRGYSGKGEIVAVFDTGFRKDHKAFKNHAIIAEHDFVFDDENVTNGAQFDSHGTGTWSCVGGAIPGQLYGPAYQASFLLAVTEDIRSETQVEEDNWVAAMEWADINGASVISSSLGYVNWYRQSDFNGRIPVTSRAASTASRKGIVVVNSAGNEGPGSPSLSAPADAFNILAVGAVDGAGNIADFSSRGPTADGRTKPEVVARGVSTFIASHSSPQALGRSSGTSFACPLVAGCAAVLLSARQDWTPLQVREALMKTASRAGNPDNTFGWGIVDLNKALDFLPAKSVVIDHKPLKDTNQTAQPYRVLAKIRAQRGVNATQSFINWRRQGTATFTKVLLQPVPAQQDQFQGLIPAQSSGITVEYFLSAKDSAGKPTTVPFPSPANLFRFKIRS